MKHKLTIKRVALVASLALAGFFGVSSVVLNNVEESSSIVNKACAETDEFYDNGRPKYVYFAVMSPWNGGYSNISKDKIRFRKSGTVFWDSWNSFGSDVLTINANGHTYYVGKKALPGSNYDKVAFGDNSSSPSYNGSTDTLTVPTNGVDNMFVLTTEYKGAATTTFNQDGYWTYFNENISKTIYSGDTDTLYFVPNYKFVSDVEDYDGYRDYYCKPRLFINFTDGLTMYCLPTGITEGGDVDTKYPSKDRHTCVFYYDNIPLKAIKSISVTHNENNSKWFTYDSSTCAKWLDGSGNHDNLFGISSSGWIDTFNHVGYTAYYYSPNQNSTAFIVGDYMLHDDIDDTQWPTKYNSLDLDEDSYYSKTLYISSGDILKYYTYDYLQNNSSNVSSWTLGSIAVYGYSNLGNITIYDKSGSAVSDKKEYVANYSDYLKFIKPGTVKIRRTTDDYSVTTLQIFYLDDSLSDNYLVGEGSFVSGTPTWSTNTGVRMTQDYENPAILGRQFLKAGDIFKIQNSSTEDEYGWDDTYGVYNTSFQRAVKANKLYIVNNHDPYDEDKGWVDGSYDWTGTGYTNYCSASSFPVYIQVTDSTWASSGAKCGFRSFDASGTIYVGSKIQGEWGQTGITFKCMVPEAAFDYGFQLVRLNSDCVEGSTITGTDKVWNYTKTNMSNDSAGTKAIFEYDEGRVYTKDSGFYSLYLDGSSRIHVVTFTDFLSGESLYLDLSDIDWYKDGVFIGAEFFVFGNAENKHVELTRVHGTDEDVILYEVKIPTGFTYGNPNRVKFYRAASIDGEWYNYVNDEGLGYNHGTNVFKLSSFGDRVATGSWTDYISNQERAEYYGTYFLEETSKVCVGDGSTDLDLLSSSWSTLCDEYNQMCTDAQTIVRNSVGKNIGVEGTDIQHAMGRYDYIVFSKQYVLLEDDTDYIGRRGLGPSIRLYYSDVVDNRFSLLTDDSISASSVTIIVISAVSVLSITTLSILLVRKRKLVEK